MGCEQTHIKFRYVLDWQMKLAIKNRKRKKEPRNRTSKTLKDKYEELQAEWRNKMSDKEKWKTFRYHELHKSWIMYDMLYNISIEELIEYEDNMKAQPVAEPPVILDSRAPYLLTPYESDFISEIKPPEVFDFKGLGALVPVAGKGTIEWPIRDLKGQTKIITTTAYL